MSVDERIESLRAKHTALESALDRENQKPLPDDIVINDLKKQKLRIKDQLAEFHIN
ncbi:MAG: YdcH family protein [Magnetovibrionaceae bacterium]